MRGGQAHLSREDIAGALASFMPGDCLAVHVRTELVWPAA
jgi:hypothetical protein